MSRRGPSFNPNPPTPVGTETDRIDPSPSNEEDAGKTYEPSNITIDKVQVDHPDGTWSWINIKAELPPDTGGQTLPGEKQR